MVAYPERGARDFSPVQPRHRLLVRHGSTLVDAEAADSLRPSAGGAHEEAKSRARDVTRRDETWQPPETTTACIPESGTDLLRRRVNLPEARRPRAFHEVTVARCRSEYSHSGLAPGGHAMALRPSHTRAPLPRSGTIMPPSGTMTFRAPLSPFPPRCPAWQLARCALHMVAHASLAPRQPARHPITTSVGLTGVSFARRRASFGLAAYLGHGAKMLRLRFYNRRSRHEHSPATSPPETAG